MLMVRSVSGVGVVLPMPSHPSKWIFCSNLNIIVTEDHNMIDNNLTGGRRVQSQGSKSLLKVLQCCSNIMGLETKQLWTIMICYHYPLFYAGITLNGQNVREVVVDAVRPLLCK